MSRWGETIAYFLYKLPYIIAQITPVGLLLAILILFGVMGKNNEIIALKSSGVSILKIFRPVFMMGALFSVILFLFYDSVVPITLNEANKVWVEDVKKKNLIRMKEKNIWVKEKSDIIYINYYDPINQSIFGLTIHSFDEEFNLNKRIDVKKAVYENKRCNEPE